MLTQVWVPRSIYPPPLNYMHKCILWHIYIIIYIYIHHYTAMANFDVDDIAKNLPFYLKLSPSRWPGSISCATFGAERTGYTAHGNDEMVCHLPLETTKIHRKNPELEVGTRTQGGFPVHDLHAKNICLTAKSTVFWMTSMGGFFDFRKVAEPKWPDGPPSWMFRPSLILRLHP